MSFYRPYRSDSESGSDSESDLSSEASSSLLSDLRSDTSSEYSQRVTPPAGPNFRALAQGLADQRLTGPSFDSSGAELQAQQLSLGFPISSGYPTFTNYDLKADPSGSKLKPSAQNVTSVVMLDSRNRDRGVFPQPTNLSLRLPRQYTNVTSFSVVQIKLLSSFFYFRPDKNNTDISILELNRTITTAAGLIVPNIIKTFIRQGTYDINSLLNELTIQLNTTPLFYDFPNGFQDFAPRFAATGDFNLNFNFPGDTYYDSLLDQYISNPTTTLIVSKYFQSQYAGLSSYTTDQIKVAYYYPVVKEVLLDDDWPDPLNLTLTTSQSALLPGETPRSRCVYTFQGLNDAVVLEVIANNVTILDDYRLKHTFRYYLINKYNVTYESQSSRITISSPSLNTSLVNLLNFKQAQFFAEQLSFYNLTQDQYNNLNAQNTILLAVLNDMFYFIQRYLATVFGINFNSYDLNYIATPTFLLPIRDGSEAVGISSNYDAAVIARNLPPRSNDILTPLRQSAKQYWNRLQGLSGSSFAFPLNLETGNPTTSSNYPYSVLLEQQDRSHSFVDSNGYLYANQLTRYADIVTPIQPTQYTVFRFKSPVRQTLQVETLPRPTKFRYPAYNAIAYDVSSQVLFDNSYSFIQNSRNADMDVSPDFVTVSLQKIPGFSTASTTANFGVNYASSIALWGSNGILTQAGDTRAFFEFYTPYPSDYLSTNAAAYRYPLSITMATSNEGPFATPMNLYLYHDRAAFMADVSDNRNEKPVHYLSSFTTTTEQSTLTMTFPVIADDTYYIMTRSRDTVFPSQTYRVVPWFPDGIGYSTLTSSLTGFDPLADPQAPSSLDNFNYVVNADPAYIKLPIQSSIQTYPPTDIQFSTLTFSTFAIGYDPSGVSTDLTNYCGFVGGQPSCNAVPSATLRIDPTSGYAFQIESPYNPTTQNYLFSNSGNAILKPQGIGVYTPQPVAARETSIVHWYGTTYLPNSENQAPMLSNQITPYVTPYTPATTLSNSLVGYTYGGSNQAIQFGDGVVGISFVPQQGVWDIQRAMFKSAYTTSNVATDANLAIEYLGVYFSAVTTDRFIHEISLDDAIAVLRFERSVTYTADSQNLGFDAGQGTYYEFIRDSNFQVGSNSYVYGYSQIRSTINTDVNSLYSFIPFDVNKNFLTFQGLVGSPVPYPFYSDASAGTTYFDGSQAPNQKGIVIPKTKTAPNATRGPPTGYDETQSKYELSMPIGTNLLQYITPYPIALTSNAFAPFNPLPFSPSLVVADVSGFIMTRDSYFRVFEYSADVTDYNLPEKYQFTLDQVYPASESNLQFMGVAANESEYAFFAYSNTPTPATSKIIIRTMRPLDGTIQATYELENLPTFDPTVQQITNITYNNYGGFTLALKQGTTVSAICKHSAATSNVTILSNADPVGFNSNVDYFITRQPPKEEFGAFYVFPYRTGLLPGPTQGSIDYVRVIPSNIIPLHNPFYKYTAHTADQTGWIASNQPCDIQVFNLSNATGAKIYKQPIVARQPFREDLFLLADLAPTKFYQVTSFTAPSDTAFTSNALTTQSAYSFPATASNLTQGGNGAKWSLIGNQLYGNRNDIVDGPRKINQAWQLFYPVQRVVFRRIAKNFTFMHTLSNLQYPEYPHTALIGYDASANITADTSRRWGLESSGNFVVADFSFSGNTFNSYAFTFPLKPNTVSKPYYYLAVRNYTPTEKSQVLLRFSLNNRYDFGYVSLQDISNEIIFKQANSNLFDPDYFSALDSFNQNFIIDSNGKIFGSNVVQGFPGSNFSNITGFGDFYGRFIGLYNQYNLQVQLVQKINAAVKSNTEAFIRSDLQYILPATSLNRQRFTDPLTYSILWRSALFPQYLKLEENWGLGFNLGYDKADTPYETVHKAQSFFKIIDDFINLRLNEEFDMNRMDTGAKENLSVTQEPTGFTKAFHGKLLLANFGSFAQTFVSNPISFYPPLGRLDKLTFTWTDALGATINNADCEWNAVVQVVEKKEVTEFSLPPLLDPTARTR